jgi:multidrug efflux pump
MLVLIGLASKNGILIVEFVQQQYAEGKELPVAAEEASRIRFRPTIMTSLAFTLGILPLVLATGQAPRCGNRWARRCSAA